MVPEIGAVVYTLLEQVPALTMLITSRQPLGLAGERQFPVAPLPVPDTRDEGKGMRDEEPSGPVLSLAAVHSSLIPHPSSPLACPRVQLLVDRVHAVQPHFQLPREH